jgi:plasmid maintenance system antidote protein VapI
MFQAERERMAKTKQPAAISEQLKAAILESGLTVYGVAKGAGIPQPVVLRFVSGQRDLRLATADKLAAFFQMKLTPPKFPKK